MRKLTPEERDAKRALNHVHDENCGHLVAESPVVAPVAEEVPAEEVPAEEAPAEEAPAEEAPAEEAPAEDKPKKKNTPKY